VNVVAIEAAAPKARRIAVPKADREARREIDRRMRALVTELGALADIADQAGLYTATFNLLALADIATHVRIARP